MDLRDLVLTRIRRRRHDLNLSQSSAGERIGIDRQTWSRWESGATELDLNMLQLVARALETTPEALIAPEPDFSPLSQEIADRAETLPERDQQEILEIIRMKERLNRAASGSPTPGAAPKKAGHRRQGVEQAAS